jgi:hypothetical protein
MTIPGRVMSLCIVAATTALCSSPSRGDDAAWEWSPYRVRFDWDGAETAPLTAEFARELRTRVEARLAEHFGAAWRYAGDEVDKRFVVRLAYERGSYAVEVQEHDVRSDTSGPAVVRRTAQREAVADLVVAAIIEAFRPVMRIDEVRAGTAQTRQRGSLLFPPTTLASLTRRGDAYAPWVRRYDRDGAPIETTAVPHTLLVVDEPRGGEAVCVVESGVRNPLGVRRRSRSEQTALAVGRVSGTTTVRVTTRDGRPLSGCTVYVQAEGAKATPLGRTDAAGAISVSADDGRVRTLVVTTRFCPLAKLPVVPGAVAEVTAPTAAEPELLAAEDRLTAWQAEFLDLFVARRVLLASAERHVEEQDRAAAETALSRLDRGDKPARLLGDLELMRRRFAGEAASNRMIASLVDEATAAAKALDDSQAVAELRRAAAKIAP